MSKENTAEEQITTTETPEVEAVTTTEAEVKTEEVAATEAETVDHKKDDQLHGLQRKTNKQKKDLRIATARIAELEATQAQNNAPAKPNVDDFDTMEAYTEAAIDYGIKQQQAPSPAYDPNRAFVDDLRHDGAAKYKDFDKVAYASPNMFDALDEMENPADIAYYLGQNPDVREKVNGMSPMAQVREFAKIEARIKTPAVITSKAPAPIKPLGTAPSTSKDVADMSMAEYAAYRNSQSA